MGSGVAVGRLEAIPRLIACAPTGLGDPTPVVACLRAGALGVLDFAPDFRAADAAEAARRVARFDPRPLGLRLPADEVAAPLLRGLPASLRVLILVGPVEEAGWSAPLSEARALGLTPLVEVASPAEAGAAIAAGADGLIAAGLHAGGRCGSIPAPALMKAVLDRGVGTRVWVRGGIDPDSARALVGAGAHGVVLDGLILAARDSGLPAGSLGRDPTTLVLGPTGSTVRVASSTDDAVLTRLRRAAVAGPDAWQEAVRASIGWGTGLAPPLGVEASQSAGLAARLVTVGRIVREVGRAIGEGGEPHSSPGPLAVVGIAAPDREGDLAGVVRRAMTDASPCDPSRAAVVIVGPDRLILAEDDAGGGLYRVDAGALASAVGVAAGLISSARADVVVLAGGRDCRGGVALRSLDDAERDGDRIRALIGDRAVGEPWHPPVDPTEGPSPVDLARAASALHHRWRPGLSDSEADRPWLRTGGPREVALCSPRHAGEVRLVEYDRDPSPAPPPPRRWPAGLWTWQAESIEGLSAALDDACRRIEAGAWPEGSPPDAGGPSTCRLAIVASDPEGLKRSLERARWAISARMPVVDDPGGLYLAARPIGQVGRLAILLPAATRDAGDGLAEVAMAFPEVRRAIERFDEALAEVGHDSVGPQLLGSGPAASDEALASAQVARLAVLEAIGPAGDGVLGVGIGEAVALHAAGSVGLTGLAAMVNGLRDRAAMGPTRRPVYSAATGGPRPVDPSRLAEFEPGQGRIGEALASMFDDGFRIFLDLGPGDGLAEAVSAELADRPHLAVSMAPPDRPGLTGLLHALGRLHAAGLPLRLGRLSELRPPWPSPTPASAEFPGPVVERPDVTAQERFVAFQAEMKAFVRAQGEAMLDYLVGRSGPPHAAELSGPIAKPMADRRAIESPLSAEVAGLLPRGLVLLIEDGRGVARAVAADLRALGFQAVRVRHGVGEGEVEGANLASPASVLALLERLGTRGPLTGLVVLPVGKGSEGASLARRLAEAALPALGRSAGRGGSCLILSEAAAPGGAPGVSAERSGAARLVRELARRWPAVRVRLVELDPTGVLEVTAANLVRELFAPAGELEVAYRRGLRFALRPEPAAITREEDRR